MSTRALVRVLRGGRTVRARAPLRVVARIGWLVGRITDEDPEVATAARWLSALLSWHGRRPAEQDRPRPDAPSGPR